MGLEFQIETYDAERVNIPEILQELPEFLRMDDDGQIHLTHDRDKIGVTVWLDDRFVNVVQHVSCRETDALFGLIIRRLLSLNDSVVVHGGY